MGKARNRLLEQETDRLLVFADAVAKIAGLALPEHDLEHGCTAALHHIAQAIPVRAAAIALLHDDLLVVKAVYGDGLDRVPGQVLARTGEALWQAVTTGKTYSGLDASHTAQPQAEQTGQYLALPLAGNSQVFGVLELQSLAVQSFDETELTLLQTIATLLSGQLAQAGRLQVLQADVADQTRQVGLIAAQYTVTRILAEAPSFMDVAEAILQTIGEQLDWEVGLMWCVQGDTNLLACTATWSAAAWSQEFLAASRHIQLPRGGGLPGCVWESKEPQWIRNVLEDQRFRRSEAAAQAGLHAAFAFPIIGQNIFFGVMEFFSSNVLTSDPELLHTTAALGRQMGQFIERRRAQQAQRESEQYTHAILETALDGIIGMDAAGRITEWNPAAERIFGYRRAEALNQELGRLIVPPAQREQHRQGLARHLATGAAYVLGRRLELTAMRADGTEFPVELAIAPVPGEQGPRFTGYVRDITERKRAEEAIRFQARLLDVVEQAVIATDVTGIVIYWNRFAETLYGWTADEALGCNILDLTPAAELLEQATQIMARLRAGESWSAEFMVRRRDGTQFPAMVIDSPIFDAEGTVIGMVGVSQDISAAKRTERNQAFLVRASTLLSTSLDYGTTLQQVADLAVPELADWCAVDLYQAGSTRLMAVAHVDPAKVALARRLRERYPVDMNAAYGVPQVLRTGKAELMPIISQELLQAAARDAEHLHLLHTLGLSSAMIVPLQARGRTLGAITLIAAESGRHYDEHDLAFAQELASRAAMAIDNALLYQAAQEAVQLRDEFLSIASHELKTPLTTMLGHSQALLRRATRQQQFGERDQRALQIIVDQTLRLNKQITTLLDVSRLELGQFRIELAPVDVAALASRVVLELEPTLERHTLHLSRVAEPLIVEGDERLLEQVLQNLLGNAVKYSVDGGTITIRLWPEAGAACVSISDQGMGIPLSAQPHLFQRFYRATNVEDHRISGLGIGLYLVHEIVTHHGGTVNVTSTEGEGSTFTVRLPLASSAESAVVDQS